MLKPILLTHSNHVYSDPKQTQKMQPYAPLQTLIAAAALRQSGFGVELCDSTLAGDPRAEFERAVMRQQPSRIVVCEDDFNFLTKMCLAQNRELAFYMAGIAQSLHIPIAVHGHDASQNPREYLAAGFDCVLTGEVEDALLELASGSAIPQVEGLVWKDERGGIRRNRPRKLRANLDALPLPAWDLVDIETYRDRWLRAHGYFSMNMVTSRGCPFRCNWCARPIHGASYHARSPRSVAQEMLLLKRQYRPDQIWFADDIFALSHRWTVEFAEAVNVADAAIPFRMQSRCDLMTRDTVGALRNAGACEAWMGAESGAQHILDAMDKGITVREIYEARENLKRYDIRACFFLQFGYPGEGWPEIEETLRMVRETKPDDIGVSVSYPLPGTAFHRMVSERIGVQANWRDSSDLAMLFRGAFSTDFYRALANALHLEVRRANPESAEAAWARVFELRDAENTVVLPASPLPILHTYSA